MGLEFIHKLPSASEVKEQYPLSSELIAQKAKRDEEIKAIFTGESHLNLLISFRFLSNQLGRQRILFLYFRCRG